MSLAINDFAESLARFIAAGAGLAYATPPRALWRNAALESDAADPYSVQRIYGGDGSAWDPVPVLAIQWMSVGKSGEAALAQNQAIYDALTQAEGRPVSMTRIDGYLASGDADPNWDWRIIGVAFLQRPGLVGVDERGRAKASFNANVTLARLAAA